MKILLLQTSFLGDTILSTPLIAAIKKLYPDCELWLMTTKIASDIVSKDPLVQGVITYDKGGKEKSFASFLAKVKELKEHRFDKVYAVQRSYRTSLLLFLSRIPQRIGFKQSRLSFLYTKTVDRPKDPHDVIRNLSLLSSEPEYLASGQALEEFFASDMRLFHNEPQVLRSKFTQVFNNQKSYSILVPGSAWKTKMWHWQGYREVAQYLLSIGQQVVLLGADKERDVCHQIAEGLEVIDLSGKTTISDSIGLIKEAYLLVCNDSMSLHMASALKIPNVSIFCATSPKFGFGPWKNNALVVEKEGLSCKPCRRHGSNTCPTGTEACMKDLPASQVISAISGLGQQRVQKAE